MKILKSVLVWVYLRVKWLRKKSSFFIGEIIESWKGLLKWLKGQVITVFCIAYFLLHALRRIFQKRNIQNKIGNMTAIVVPKDYTFETFNFNGGTKDIQSMLEQITKLDIPYELFQVPRKTTHALLSLLRDSRDFFSASHILLSIPGSSGLLFPYLRILGFSRLTFRSHNAELLHRWDWIRSTRSVLTILKSLKKMFFGFLSDFFVSTCAENILSVSEKEIEIYWEVLFPWSKGKVKFFPGASPSHIQDIYSSKQPIESIRPYATIVGGFESGTSISKADRLFLDQGTKIHDYFNSLGFSLVSIGNKINYDFCDINFGFINNFEEVLSKSEIIIIPTSRGWGFKTKIADAVTLHQSVVVTQTLYNRLGFWSQMVSPLKDWADISSLKVRAFSADEYRVFLEKILLFREDILLEIFKKEV